MFLDYLKDALADSVKLIPFLFVIYLIMEVVERHGSEGLHHVLQKGRKFGPLIGGVAGVIPQCGCSTAGAALYSERVISLGTMVAVFLSTSDEMLPIMISESAPVMSIIRILAVKVVIGIISGYLTDAIFRKIYGKAAGIPADQAVKEKSGKYNVFVSAIMHTMEIFIYIFILECVLNTAIGLLGEDTISKAFTGIPVVGEFIAALIGLIPNCASSVIITQLYMEHVINAGAMFAGLLANAGAGSLVLFKMNPDKKQNKMIIFIIWTLAVIWGVIIEATGISFKL